MTVWGLRPVLRVTGGRTTPRWEGRTLGQQLQGRMERRRQRWLAFLEAYLTGSGT